MKKGERLAGVGIGGEKRKDFALGPFRLSHRLNKGKRKEARKGEGGKPETREKLGEKRKREGKPVTKRKKGT